MSGAEGINFRRTAIRRKSTPGFAVVSSGAARTCPAGPPWGEAARGPPAGNGPYRSLSAPHDPYRHLHQALRPGDTAGGARQCGSLVPPAPARAGLAAVVNLPGAWYWPPQPWLPFPLLLSPRPFLSAAHLCQERFTCHTPQGSRISFAQRG